MKRYKIQEKAIQQNTKQAQKQISFDEMLYLKCHWSYPVMEKPEFCFIGALHAELLDPVVQRFWVLVIQLVFDICRADIFLRTRLPDTTIFALVLRH